ncbi:BirA family biotin operon repressor/biotin-[acetyl-CoA-carboxylase] ligase [Oribacterium sinus]|uniref:biotin--[biotin carboxyl-carrier protein] ligase n=1 Tax=Oribacterium sinus TaxID=237576 RepID=A0A7W9SHQ7_9FIRM|nr:biotin--[acetyl-CoA-carboxylase] ligase [Oribacterium sinus]MBB6042403.1 BirA family biotin operon repressor/biotin-[acetyl-CoA-carboxylase] ligase [Oribacterium sinus]
MEPLSSTEILRFYQLRNQGILALEPHVQLFDEIDSTNTECKRRIQELPYGEDIFSHIPEGTVFLSDYQTAGRGRMGKSFLSPKGSGLYFSILTKPKGQNKNPLVLTCHAAVAVKRAVKEVFGMELSIKWVNDLFYKGKKLVGILAEGQLSDSTSLTYCIMGIGINLFLPESGFPEELSNIAGALFDYDEEKKENINRNQFLASILFHYFSLLDEDKVEEEYRTENILLTKDILFTENHQDFLGRVEGILEDGALSVRCRDGSTKIVSSGEVKEKFL